MMRAEDEEDDLRSVWLSRDGIVTDCFFCHRKATHCLGNGNRWPIDDGPPEWLLALLGNRRGTLQIIHVCGRHPA